MKHLKKANPWFDWENFDPSSEADVMRFQKEFNKRAKEAGSDSRIKEDGKFGEQTASARFTPGTPGQEPEVEVAEVEETTTETTTAAPQKLTPIPGRAIPPRVDYPLDPNQLLGEQYAMATGQVQPVFAQGYSPQLRVPYDISLQTAKNDVIAQSRALERNPALQNNPAALANLQAPTYAALNKINEAEFMANQKMKDTVYSGNIDALNKARLVNLGIYDTQADRMADAASKTRTQNIDILSSISNKYAQKRRENMLERIYGNMYPSFAYDKDGNIVQTGSASFSIPGQGVVGGYPGFTNMGGVAGGVQNVLAGAQMLNQFLKYGRDTKTPSEDLTPISPVSPVVRSRPTAGPVSPIQFEPGEITARMIQDPTFISQQGSTGTSGNWWEQEPQGKKGKTIKKNNKNSNILRALRNL